MGPGFGGFGGWQGSGSIISSRPSKRTLNPHPQAGTETGRAALPQNSRQNSEHQHQHQPRAAADSPAIGAMTRCFAAQISIAPRSKRRRLAATALPANPEPCDPGHARAPQRRMWPADGTVHDDDDDAAAAIEMSSIEEPDGDGDARGGADAMTVTSVSDAGTATSTSL